jgi:hypothetical protein
MNKKTGQFVLLNPASVRLSEYRHPPFGEAYRPFFERMSRVFADVSPDTPEKWEDYFRRDRNPEREMACWTEMANHYEYFTSGRNMTLDRKKEVHEVLLRCLSNGGKAVLRYMKPRYLSRREVKDIVERVRRVTGDRTWPIVVSRVTGDRG